MGALWPWQRVCSSITIGSMVAHLVHTGFRLTLPGAILTRTFGRD